MLKSAPLARAAYWKREARLQEKILDGVERPSHEYDIAFNAYADAKANFRRIIQTEWDARRMERFVPRINHIGLTATEVAEAVSLKAVA